jgi:hypothetical protein
MPERIANTDPFKLVTEAIGSGPFKFKADDRVPGAFFAHERFAGYVPRPDGFVEWTSGPRSRTSSGRVARDPRPVDGCGGDDFGRNGLLGGADRLSSAAA